ncbi:Plasma membrane t-SNARE, secretory vesicle fusion [Clydaea vesicula]|uniref:Plasma membrane t-SNARE, secretory vesicle fusion n=1 Tax=Clydaea vesicula TaxID=447962 RepID=A0AAD5TZL0_9FUNG|nr:Plasma membrane t-SNARE, secretory vesicle fusion [Clydaea vesicula]
MKLTEQKSLARKLIEVAKEYQNIQQSAKTQYRGQLERQFKIAKPNATREEITEALDNNSGGNVFQQQILSSRVTDQRRILDQVQNRQQELNKIEQSLVELFQLMQDMQMMLENQQTMIDQIETNIEDSSTAIEYGSKELTKATDNARSARKKKWIIFFCVLILLIIVGLVVWFQFVAPLVNAANAANNGNGSGTTPVTTTAAAASPTPS